MDLWKFLRCFASISESYGGATGVANSFIVEEDGNMMKSAGGTTSGTQDGTVLTLGINSEQRPKAECGG